jgi:hypothetical protein
MAPMPVNAGNLIIVSTMGGDNQTAVSDSIGNTYIPLTSRNNGVSVWNKFYYCFSMTSHAANVVTVSVVNNQGNNMAYAVVYEGVSQYDGVDVGNLSNSASFTTTAKGLVLIAFYHTGAGSPSPGSTMTVPSSGPVNIPPPVHTGIFWYQDLWQWVTPAALVGQTVTITTSGGTALCICAFK